MRGGGGERLRREKGKCRRKGLGVSERIELNERGKA